MNMPAPLLSFPDRQSGMGHLARLPLANSTVADQQLNQFLDSLLASPPSAPDLFALLEQARVPMGFVEEEIARRYHNKPLVLGDLEEKLFQQVVVSWRKMGKAYALCARLHNPNSKDPEHARRVAAILHRCIYYAGMVIHEHYRARRELPSGIWLDVHGLFQTAEEWGIALTPVDDMVEHEAAPTHCTAAYVAILLADLATPYSQSVRDLNLIRRWSGLWAPLVSIAPIAKEDSDPPFVVELMKDACVRPAKPKEQFGEDARRLDTSRLAAQVQHMLGQLRQRTAPSQLGLGEETAGHVLQLLEHVARPWSQSAAARKFRRFQTEGTARVAIGLEAMHFFVSGKEFVQPEAAQAYSRSEFNTLFTFRHMVNSVHHVNVRAAPSFPVDEWEVINHSANGFRLTRSIAGQKMAHGQLIAICPHDGDHFLLGQVCWLMQEQKGGLIAGLAVLPGLPEGIAVRQSEAFRGQSSTPYTRAFLLPAVPAIKEAASIVLPVGFYRASRTLDVIQGEMNWCLRMKTILKRGVDFERVSFEVV